MISVGLAINSGGVEIYGSDWPPSAFLLLGFSLALQIGCFRRQPSLSPITWSSLQNKISIWPGTNMWASHVHPFLHTPMCTGPTCSFPPQQQSHPNIFFSSSYDVDFEVSSQHALPLPPTSSLFSFCYINPTLTTSPLIYSFSYSYCYLFFKVLAFLFCNGSWFSAFVSSSPAALR